jgi:hypothetical protein
MRLALRDTVLTTELFDIDPEFDSRWVRSRWRAWIGAASHPGR